jgi:hypothetical protein
VKGRYDQRIDETIVSEPGWAQTHWKTLVHSYAGAAHFDRYRERFEQTYMALERQPRLSLINRRLLEEVCDVLGIRTTLTWSTDYAAEGTKTGRLVSICRAAGATHYLSGPRAREYLDEQLFAEAGIELSYMAYDGYPPYPQLHPPFEHDVTILDLLFNVGADASRFLKSAPVR